MMFEKRVHGAVGLRPVLGALAIFVCSTGLAADERCRSDFGLGPATAAAVPVGLAPWDVHKGQSSPLPPPPAIVSPGLQIVKVLRRTQQTRGDQIATYIRTRDPGSRPFPFPGSRSEQSAILANTANLTRLCRLLL